MKSHMYKHLMIFLILFTFIQKASGQNTVGLISRSPGIYDGYTLYAPLSSTSTYLIDNNGERINSWVSAYNPGNSAYLLEDGHLLRTANNRNSRFTSGGTGGRIEKFTWDGSLVWTYIYSTDSVCQHHDIELLPNGNILMIAWELKTLSQALAAGCNPALVNNKGLYPDHIIEVNPTLPSGSEIVWEWHVWDHLIQEYDSSKDNYGVVADHPELIDLNFTTLTGPPRSKTDWNHTNGIDYNADLDQIVISIHVFSEIWIIDHSTSTTEAASHSGGNSGRGGDLLYRWGNPAAYGAGTAVDQQLFGQHDPQWLTSDLPGSGNLLIFNNGRGRINGNFSSIDEITPPLEEDGSYTKNTGTSYGPVQPVWTYQSDPVDDFYADHISGAQRLPNGNTLICDGTHGTIFEVTQVGNTVWEYINPVTADGPLAQGDDIPTEKGGNNLFRACRYGKDYPAFSYLNLYPLGPIETYSSPFPESDIFTRIPSDSAGERGLIVRISLPAFERFATGAPIVIYMPGGFNADGLNERYTGLGEHGFIEIRFSFPGAGTYPFDSDGIDDHRGKGSLLAARDIIRFALGLQADISGKTISELLDPVSPDYTNVGLVGWSNGGNTNICTVGIHGADIPGLAWILNWESPVGDGMPQAEAGAKSENSLRPYNTGVNPAYNPATGSWDLSGLAWDDQLQIPVLERTNDYKSGGLYIDVNGDQIIDKGSDFIFYPLIFEFNGRELAFFSERVLEAATAEGLIPAQAPDHIVTNAENEEFWHWRNGALWVDEALQHNPDLMFMIVASDTDHVQIAPDHPHVIIQYNAFLNGGCRFVRLNPDKSYIENYTGNVYPAAVDNDAFMPLQRTNMTAVVESGNSINQTFNKVTVAAAGACELADRTFHNNTSPQLDGLATLVISLTGEDNRASIFQNSPNPFNNSTQITFTLNKNTKIKLDVLNVLGQQVAELFEGNKTSGTHSIIWNADQQSGGVYFVRLATESRTNLCKCLLIK
ncbi:aryl-sulfate sulfotransferase [bacterium]|nr:aryl-sulfate sulfotransferase [bacterium]